MARKSRYERSQELTPRDKEVLQLLRRGLTDAEIAEIIGISRRGVSYHVSQIIAKLGVRNRYEAAAWPHRPPWLPGLALIATWRQLRQAGKIATHLSAPAAAAALASALLALGVLAFFVLRTPHHDATVSPNVLDDLGPGTTLHLTTVHFQRHGPADDVLKLSDSYQPETVYNETWIAFDENGNAASVRAETRGEDGKLYGSSRSDGNDIVYEDARGEEHRISGELDGMTVETVRAAMVNRVNEASAVFAQHPDAPVVKIGAVETRAIETQRRPMTRPMQDVAPGNYVSVYMYDLQPVEEVRRSYISAEGLELRSEVAVVDATGTETVVERSESSRDVLADHQPGA